MIDLSTQEKKNAAISNFKTLLTHPGWVMFEEIVRANMEIVKKQILDGDDKQTLDDVKMLRRALSLHTEMINTPRDMIERLSLEATVTRDVDDPYDTAEDIAKQV